MKTDMNARGQRFVRGMAWVIAATLLMTTRSLGGPKEDFSQLEIEMQTAEEAYYSALMSLEDEARRRSAEGTEPAAPPAPPPDGRKSILRKMDALAEATAGKPEAAEIAIRTFEWGVHIDPESALDRFEKLVRQFPDERGLGDFVPVIPDLVLSPDVIPKWLLWLDQLRKLTKHKETQIACWFTIGRLQLSAGRLPVAKQAFEAVRKEAKEPELIEAAKAFIYEIERLQPGMEAPDFSAKTLEGKDVSLKSLRGKVVLLKFWATWCAPCVGEIPHLQALATKMAGKPFEILAVSVDDEREALTNLLSVHRMPGIQTWDEKGEDNPVAGQYNVRELPTSYLIDKSGVIRERDPGPEKLAATIESLLNAPSSSPPAATRTEKPSTP